MPHYPRHLSCFDYRGFHRYFLTFSLWQRYGFERVLRDEEDTASVVKYVIENPLRAGLVNTPLDYPFWGSGVYSREALIEYISQAGEWAG